MLLSKLFSEPSKSLVEPKEDMHVKATEIVTSNLLSLIRHSHVEHNILVNVALKKLLENDLRQ